MAVPIGRLGAILRDDAPGTAGLQRIPDSRSEKTQSKQPAARQPVGKLALNVAEITDYAASIGLELTELEADKLAGGDELSLNGKRWRAGSDGVIRKAPTSYAEKRSAIMSRVFALKNHRKQS